MFQVFLDVCKAYNSMYRGKCMDILKGFGLGPKIRRLIQWFWYDQVVLQKVREVL